MSVPNRYEKWLRREADIRLVEDAYERLDRQSDYLAETTGFGRSLRRYVEGIVGVKLIWSRRP